MPEDEAVETVTKPIDEGFYALILDKLIDEACTVNNYSLSLPKYRSFLIADASSLLATPTVLKK